MSCSCQINVLACLLCCLSVISAMPIFQGIKVQKGFDIEFKPFTFKPISFFKEKWSPFFRSGIRKGIEKRDLSEKIVAGDPPLPPPIAPAPVHEPLEEVRQEQQDGPAIRELIPGPDPVRPGLSNFMRTPVIDTLKPLTDGLYTNIGPIPPVSNNLIERPAEVVLDGIYGELPPRPVGPVPARVPFFQGPIAQGSIAQGQFAQGPIAQGPIAQGPIAQGPIAQGPIAQGPIAMTVVPLLTPPPPVPVVTPTVQEIPPTEGPLVRGSRIALYLGRSFVKMVSEFIANAKLQLSQFSTPPPPSPVPPPVPLSN